ncbi:hypothetical protein VT84_16755 [Gemmata sp. SH-PL17]|uniref:hypothetical protein n=1 Tax=Gemmata sp. SH-PL17 TaxID=1630693 RepID=UPI0004B25A96|nr:hypothetical protein [Gemmata sp. SH-PL17]AMV26051.1 hypothetical protein VT84_16755 [Gemmata sp. SH-PL17]
MNPTPFELLAERASARPFFLGFRLAEFAARESLDDAALAAQLGCDVATLAHVRMCRAPRTESSAVFGEDVTCVATKFGLNVRALADATKLVPAAIVRDATSLEPAGAVLAARDRSDVP